MKEHGLDLAQVKDSSHPRVYPALLFLKLFFNFEPRRVYVVQLLKGCDADGFDIISLFHLGRYLMCD